MNAADALSLSGANLRRRKGRTALTAAGVVVGVAALVLMVSLGLGVKLQMLGLFETEDALTLISVSRVRAGGEGEDKGPFDLFQLGGQIVPITEKDLAEIRAVPGVKRAMPDLNMILRVTTEAADGARKTAIFPVGGIVPEDEPRYAAALLAGRLGKAGEDWCVVPDSFLRSRAGSKPEEILGAKVTLQSLVSEGDESKEETVFTVTGVFSAERFGFKGGQILMPMDRALKVHERIGGNPWMAAKKGTWLEAEARVDDPRSVPEVKKRLKALGYNAVSATDIISAINLVFLIVEGFMACIGAIGLVVSLFGIANTMAMAVLERTREIGIMKALGARDRDIGRLFLLEAAAVGALGGFVGLGLGWAAGKVLNAAARGLFDMPPRVSLFHVSLWLAAGSVLFSIFVSVLAGYLPARRAARMDPVAALRYE